MNNKKTIIILILILVIGIVGVTIAYFANSTSLDNTFNTKPYGNVFTEEFDSPSNWLPGTTTEKTVVATNTGEVAQAVRIKITENWKTKNNDTLNGWIHTDGTKSTHSTENELATDERVALINFTSPSDWTKVGDYYYYNYKLAPQESTTSLIESVTFNSKTKLNDTCTTTEGNGTKTVTCNSSGSDYDNATYTLTFNIETVQFNKYKEAWGVSNNNAAMKPMNARELALKSNPISVTNYTDGDIHEMYTFQHPATEQTPALTDYRYIGNDPYNYVEFNCDDNGENCEIWRAIGVFNVDDGEGNWEWRVKLVRNNGFPTAMKWDTKNTEQYTSGNFGKNDWPDAEIKLFLNDNYFYRSGDASTYGLKPSARSMISDTKYYLGGASVYNYNKDTEQYDYHKPGSGIYLDERDIKVYSNNFINWIGKIGLIYSSDYIYTYSNMVDNFCFDEPNQCDRYGNGNHYSSWMYYGNHLEYSNEIYNTLLITVGNSSSTTFNIIFDKGFIHPIGGYQRLDGVVRPTLYLSSSVKIIDGDGSINNPYKLSGN